MRWRPVARRLPLTGVAVAGAVVGHVVAYVVAVPSPAVRVALLRPPARRAEPTGLPVVAMVVAMIEELS